MESRAKKAGLHRLTAREVQAASAGDHADGGGLFLRVTEDSASWVLRYTGPTGKRREMGLGIAHRDSPKQAGSTLTMARDLAHAARDLVRRGLDPIDERDRLRTAGREAEQTKKAEKARDWLTLARAARQYHERAVEPRLTVKHSAQWIASLENHVPTELWHAPIANVTAPQVLAALSKVRAIDAENKRVPETLKRIRQRLDAIFEDAIFHGHCTTNPAAAVRRKMRETLPAKKAGQFKALAFKDAPAFLRRVREAQGTAARCLEFAVLTTSRTNPAILAEWAEFDLEAGLWQVPAEKMKAKEDHTVALSPGALAVLAAQRGQCARYVFPTTMGEGNRPMCNMSMLVLLKRLGVSDKTTVHGLCRATFSTWAYETAAARADVIEACLAHREADKVKAAYNRAQFFDERRALLAKWGEFLAHTAQVVQLPTRAA